MQPPALASQSLSSLSRSECCLPPYLLKQSCGQHTLRLFLRSASPIYEVTQVEAAHPLTQITCIIPPEPRYAHT